MARMGPSRSFWFAVCLGGWMAAVRAGESPELHIVTLGLEVDTCDAFDETASVEAFCEPFVEEAGFPGDTVCLANQSACETESLRLRRRVLTGLDNATIVLGGRFGDLNKVEVIDLANSVLQEHDRVGNVQSNAVGLLNQRGTKDLASRVGSAQVTGGSSTAKEVVDPDCTMSQDCDTNSIRPVCLSNFCVACGPIRRPATQSNCQVGEFCRADGRCSTDQCTSSNDCGGTKPICDNKNNCVECSKQESPAMQGNCPDGTLCRIDGSCLPNLQPNATFVVDVLLDSCAGATFLDWCKLDERASGITRITSNVPAGGPDSALETTTTCDTDDKASAFGVYAPVGLFNGITFEAFVETLDTLGFEFYKSRDGGCGAGNEESAPRLEVVVSGPVGGETSTTSFTLEPTFTLEFGNGPVTDDEWIQISSGPDDGSGLDNCNKNVGGLGFYTTGYSNLFEFSGFFSDFRCSLDSWIQTLKNEGFDSFVEEGKIVGLTFSLGSFNAGVEGYVNGLNVRTTDFDWTWTFVANN